MNMEIIKERRFFSIAIPEGHTLQASFDGQIWYNYDTSGTCEKELFRHFRLQKETQTDPRAHKGYDFLDDTPKEPINMEWVSVKDRLPENDRQVIVFNKSSGVICAKFSCNWYSLNELICYRNVTHWMPLPDPPKEK